MYTLYVIPGSHACRSAMLMLDHKRVQYKRVDIITLLHPVVARLHGFDAGGETRTAGGSRPASLRLGDLLGTVPGLAADEERISTNRRIARFLDERIPADPLFPADPSARAAVETAETWANETLQMAARRVVLPAWRHDATGFARATGDGRLGPLLYRQAFLRRVTAPIIARTFAVDAASDRSVLDELPGMLDRIDAWIGEGVLGGDQLNVADFMVAPSLALMLYRPDVRPTFEGRPALALVDRLLPEPGAVNAV
jgi:glutathione S-transferase